VREIGPAREFYRQLLPALGFERETSGEEWFIWQARGDGAVEFFGFTESPAHQPNDNRIAFWAKSRAEVDQLAEVARRAGARKLEGPALWREYSPGYYAVFFEDPSGNRLEICCREQRLA
jgi:catechol 2,3-dioxygenase-like lactoylglutathione lyase family enzyme